MMSTDQHWEQWARQDAYFSVLTDGKYRSAALTTQAREDFFASGSSHVAHVLAVCRKHLGMQPALQRVLDFGCGVGRVAIPFAQHAQTVVGLDVSPAMLAEAARNCATRDAPNVQLLLSDDKLSAVYGQFDLVHSCIVLQHIAASRGRQLFAQLVERVAPGGIGALHVTYGWSTLVGSFGQPPPDAATANEATATDNRPMEPAAESGWLQRLRGPRRPLLGRERRDRPLVSPPQNGSDPDMQMHCYQLNELVFLVQRAGVQSLHVELTDHGGALGVFLFFRKQGRT